MYIWSQTGKDAEARKGASRERGNRSLPFPVGKHNTVTHTHHDVRLSNNN